MHFPLLQKYCVNFVNVIAIFYPVLCRIPVTAGVSSADRSLDRVPQREKISSQLFVGISDPFYNGAADDNAVRVS